MDEERFGGGVMMTAVTVVLCHSGCLLVSDLFGWKFKFELPGAGWLTVGILCSVRVRISVTFVFAF